MKRARSRISRATSRKDPWEAFCGSNLPEQPKDERSSCNGSEVVQCFGANYFNWKVNPPHVSTIHLDDCSSYGFAPSCAAVGPTMARCKSSPSILPPPPLSPSPETIVQLEFREDRGCALRRSGRVDCWGPTPDVAPVSGLTDVIGLSVNGLGFYALRKSGEVVASDSTAKWKNGFSTVFSVPGAIELAGHCVRRGDGSVACFEEGSSPKTIAGIEGAEQIAAGADPLNPKSSFACARTATGTVRCWGSNDYGKLGSGTSGESLPTSALPLTVGGIDDAIDLGASSATACVVRASGKVACWGWIWTGTLTSEGYTKWKENASPLPVELGGVSDAVRVSVGKRQVCALRKGGTVTCWGSPYHERFPSSRLEEGYLGGLGAWGVLDALGASEAVSPPIDIREFRAASYVKTSSDGKGACAIASGGTDVWCWGDKMFTESALPGDHHAHLSVPRKVRF